MIEIAWHEYNNTADMADAVASDVAGVIENALDARGEAFVALPGGTSPIPAFERLAAAHINWDKVTIIPTDDRLVPITHPLSNAAMIANRFLPRGARVLPFVAEETNDYRKAGREADAGLSELNWPLDLVWLGVGADGHTASIFPGPDLEDALNGAPIRRAVGVLPDPMPVDAPVARITLSRAAILSARVLLITFSGTEKRAVIERALRAGAHSRTPIGRVLSGAKGPIDIRWCAK